MRRLFSILACSLVLNVVAGGTAFAQAATIQFDYGVGTPVATVQNWVAKLYINTSPAIVLNDVCLVAGSVPNQVVTCTATLPNITAQLTPTGVQRFEVTLSDALLGESPRSSPLDLTRPSAPSAPRIQ